MPAVLKKQKQKSADKSLSLTKEKKFVSESLEKRKPKQLKRKVPKHRRRGVVYIKHLPHGFYEEQLRGYFSQFGAITRLRLARSPKTLGSKGFAFIEFRYPEVAEIAADAMNNYIMFKNIIKSVHIKPEEIKHDYFRSGIKRIKKDGQKVFTSSKVQARAAVVEATNRLMTTEDEEKRIAKIGSKLQKSKQKLAALGIDYDIDEVAANMGEAVMKAAEKAKPATLDNLKLDSEDEADETFDPSALNIDSEEEFEDFEYDSEHTDDDDGIDVNIDEEKLGQAIKVAQEARTKASLSSKKGKRKETEELEEVAAKKTKPNKKGKENKSEIIAEPKVAKNAGKKEKVSPPVKESAPKAAAAKKGAKAKASVAEPEPEVSQKPARKGRAAAKVVEVVEKPTAVKEKAAKKAKQEAAPVVKAAKQPRGKAAKPETPATPVTPPQVASKGKKAQKNQKPAAELVEPVKPTKGKKAAAAKPQVESPVVPAKTKKLAKASTTIEKKKPVKADKKLKAAAEVAISSDLVKTVKGKELKGKKKAAAKK